MYSPSSKSIICEDKAFFWFLAFSNSFFTLFCDFITLEIFLSIASSCKVIASMSDVIVSIFCFSSNIFAALTDFLLLQSTRCKTRFSYLYNEHY